MTKLAPALPIEVDSETGVWTSDALPMLYVPRHFFINNHVAIEEALGAEKYAEILYHAGYKSAWHWCEKEAECHGIEGEAVRGYMLRRLRVAPGTTYRVSVLDDAAENAADEALADGPAHVVLLAADWLLSPRQVKRLQARVRSAVGPDVPVIWLVVSEQDGAPGAPGPDYMQHWETLIDDLRDPTTEIAAYDPTA